MMMQVTPPGPTPKILVRDRIRGSVDGAESLLCLERQLHNKICKMENKTDDDDMNNQLY